MKRIALAAAALAALALTGCGTHVSTSSAPGLSPRESFDATIGTTLVVMSPAEGWSLAGAVCDDLESGRSADRIILELSVSIVGSWPADLQEGAAADTGRVMAGAGAFVCPAFGDEISASFDR